MTLDDTFTKLAAFLNSLDAEGEQKFELSHSLVIICPDCGKNIAFRGRCPKCASNSWIPAGHAGGIFERMKAQRLHDMITSPDDTASIRGDVADERPVAATAVADEAVAYATTQPVEEEPPAELEPVEDPEPAPDARAAAIDVTTDEPEAASEPVPDATDSPRPARKRRRRR